MPLEDGVVVVRAGNDIPSAEDLSEGWEAADVTSNMNMNVNSASVVSSATLATASKRRSPEANEDAHSHKKTRLFNSLGDIIRLRVGPDEVLFNVHLDVLRDASPVLADRALPAGGQRSTQPVDIVMSDECADSIQSMCYWLYNDQICISQKLDRARYYDPRKTSTGLFVELYIIGQNFKMSGLQNDAIDAILSCCRAMDLVLMSTYIYQKTQPRCKLRRLLVKLVSYRYSADELQDDMHKICNDFLFDLAIAAFRDRDKGVTRYQGQVPPQENFCADFHTHEAGVGRCRRMKGHVTVTEERP